MKKIGGLLFVVVVVAVTVALAQPQERPAAPRQCSAATLRGDYLYAGDGFQVKGSDARSRTPIAEAGRETYDGAGKVKGVFTFNENGVTRRGTVTATYTLKADCTGTITIYDTSTRTTSHCDLYTTPAGDEVVWIQTDPNTVFAGWNRRRPMPPIGMGPGGPR